MSQRKCALCGCHLKLCCDSLNLHHNDNAYIAFLFIGISLRQIMLYKNGKARTYSDVRSATHLKHAWFNRNRRVRELFPTTVSHAAGSLSYYCLTAGKGIKPRYKFSRDSVKTKRVGREQTEDHKRVSFGQTQGPLQEQETKHNRSHRSKL